MKISALGCQIYHYKKWFVKRIFFFGFTIKKNPKSDKLKIEKFIFLDLRELNTVSNIL